jgi:hypothetical protein
MSRFSKLLDRVKRLEAEKERIEAFEVSIIFRDGSIVDIDEYFSWPEEKRKRFDEVHDVGEWDVEKIDVKQVPENYT